VREGFEVQVVADAGGSPSRISDDMALRWMERGGVTLTSINQLVRRTCRQLDHAGRQPDRPGGDRDAAG
jgi:hypothetical protein